MLQRGQGTYTALCSEPPPPAIQTAIILQRLVLFYPKFYTRAQTMREIVKNHHIILNFKEMYNNADFVSV